MWESILPTMSAWWVENRPSNASLRAGIFDRSLPRANSASISGSVVPLVSASAQKPSLRRQAREWPHKRALSQRLGAPSLGAEPLLCAPRFLSLAVAGEIPQFPYLSLGGTKL